MRLPKAGLSGLSSPRARRAALSCLLLAGLAGCGLFGGRDGDIPPLEFQTAETSVDYEVALEGAPEAAVDMLEQSLSLYRRQDDGAPSIAILRRRAEQDIETAKTVMRSYGYYSADARVEVERLEDAPAEPAQQPSGRASYSLSDLFGGSDDAESEADAEAEAEEDAAPDAPQQRALARLIVEPGPAFKLIRHDFVLVDVPEGRRVRIMTPLEAGSPIEGPAEAAAILEAEDQAVADLLYRGRPWAQLQGRRAIADMENATIEIESRVSPGPFVRYGRVEIEGTEHVRTGHIRKYREWRNGAPVDRRSLRDYQSELMATELFDAAVVKVPDQPPETIGENEEIPILVEVEEAARRTVTAGLRYNTDSGPEAKAGFTHRNLFGAGERIDLTAVGGQQEQSLSLEGRKPQFLRRRQFLTGLAEARHVEQEAYDETGATLSVGLERQKRRYWTFGGGGLIEYSQINDQLYPEDVLLFGLPAYVRYDGSNDLLNPTEGLRADLSATPFYASRERGDSQFVSTEAVVTGYLPLDDENRYVLAGRGRWGTIFAESLNDVPLTKRLYSGGGGSVRGYGDQMVGPLDPVNDPSGGRSALEASAEIRARVWGDIGVVGFVDAGSVSTEVTPTFSDRVLYSAGAGVRYYSPVGPIRFDLALPINGRSIDDSFALYFSIGQAY